MPYKFLEEIATADIAFKAWGESLEETFVSAADATTHVMVEALDSVEPREERFLKVQDQALDLVLFDFLQELIYYKDSEKLILRIKRVEIQHREGEYLLEAVALGEPLDSNRHRPRVDVKAVTLHRFLLEKTGRGWEASVILDI